MKREGFLFLVLVMLFSGCAHYSLMADRSEPENIIVAPIQVVWKKALELLPEERITINTADESAWMIKGRKGITFWSVGDNVTIRLYPKSSGRTVVHIEAHPWLGTTMIGCGHNERMVLSLFEKLKILCSKNEQ